MALDKLEKARNELNITTAEPKHNAESTGHARTLSWAESVSPSTGPDGVTVAGTTPTAGASGFWAIKIVDRQPRKKLPGVRKSIGPSVNGADDAKQIIATNEKYGGKIDSACGSSSRLTENLLTGFVRKSLS